MFFRISCLTTCCIPFCTDAQPRATKPAFNIQKVAVNSMAAASLASALVIGPMADAVDMMDIQPNFGSSNLVAERVTREGLYREYDVDVGDQVFDDARSTYKSAKETKTKKGTIANLVFTSHLLLSFLYLVHLYCIQFLRYHRKVHCFDRCSRRRILHHTYGSILLVRQG